MNVRRFTARNTREALRLVREALGDDAVVLSTKPSPGGVEVVAMPPESLGRLEAMSTLETTPRGRAASRRRRSRRFCRGRVACRRPRRDQRRAGRRAPVDEHALVSGLRSQAHAEAPPGVARRCACRWRGAAPPQPLRRVPAPRNAPRRASRRHRPVPAGRGAPRRAGARSALRSRCRDRAGQPNAGSPPRRRRATTATCSPSCAPSRV